MTRLPKPRFYSKRGLEKEKYWLYAKGGFMKKIVLLVFPAIIGASIAVIAMYFAYHRIIHLTKESEEKIVSFNNEKAQATYDKIEKTTTDNFNSLENDLSEAISELTSTSNDRFRTIATNLESSVLETKVHTAQMLKEMTSANLESLDVMKNEVAESVDAIKEKSSTILDETSKQYTEILESIQNTVSENLTDIKQDTAQMLAETSAQNSATMEAMKKESSAIIEATRGIIFTREESAEKSYSAAMKIKSSDTKNAMLYLLNAINHVPTEMKYIEAYYDILASGGNFASEELFDMLTNAESVLEACVYQVDHENIGKVNAMINAISEAQQKLIERENASESAKEKAELTKLYNDLKKKESVLVVRAKSTATETDISALEAFLQDAENFITQTAENADYKANSAEISRIYGIFSPIRDFVLTCRQIEQVLPKLETAVKDGKYNLADGIASIFETLLYQAVQQPVAMSALTEQNWLDFYVKRKNAVVATLNVKKSEPILAQIKATSNNVSLSGNSKQKIDNLQRAINSISEQIRTLYDADSLNKATKEIEKLQENIGSIQQAQVKAYQYWAANVVLDAKSRFDSSKKKNDDVMDVIRYTDICAIDQSLIIPEISSVLQTLIAEMYSKVDKSSQRYFNQRFMTSSKRTLEDF